MKKDMLYFAEIDYKLIIRLKDDEDLQDAVLVHCEQATEKYMKYLLQREFGVKDTTHAITRMGKELSELYPRLRNFNYIIRILKDSYFDRRYETDNYEHITREEFTELLTESLELIDYLRELCKPNSTQVKSF